MPWHPSVQGDPVPQAVEEGRDQPLPAKVALRRPLDACGCHSAHSSMIQRCTASLRLSVQFLRSNQNEAQNSILDPLPPHTAGSCTSLPIPPTLLYPFLWTVQSCDLSLTAPRAGGPAAFLTAPLDPLFFHPAMLLSLKASSHP